MKNVEILNLTTFLDTISIKSLDSDDFINIIRLKDSLNKEVYHIKEECRLIANSAIESGKTKDEADLLVQKYLMKDSDLVISTRISEPALISICKENDVKLGMASMLKTFICV